MTVENIEDTGGWIASITALIMNIYNWISIENINGVVVFCTTVFAAFYMYYKFKNERMKHRHFKNLKKEDEDETD